MYKYLIVASAFLLPISALADSVTVCSKKHSARCVTGQTKVYDFGKKVRLPGGTWVDCAGDCQNKLREKTVDFWYEKKLRN
jgi:uncharacterized Fe-S cluster protein YjdI